MARVIVEISPELLRWAIERSGLDASQLADKFPALPDWERGTKHPTFKQLETFADTTRTPIGYFFLSTPPTERIPIPDFRTPGNAFIERPTPDLIETIYLCQRRQEWYRDYARAAGDSPLPFVGSATTQKDPIQIAREIRGALGLSIEERRHLSNWEDARRHLIEKADAMGVLTMVSGVVGNNNSRPLNPDEFRGFALADEYAPLVFVNGADTKAAQMFTLAHELAHIWLGKTALDDAQPATTGGQGVEKWCNRVAAELLVPLEMIREAFARDEPLRAELDRLAREFKVSTLVILRRVHDAGHLREDDMWNAYRAEVKRLKDLEPVNSGGDYYATARARVGRRFLRAVMTSALEGRTLHRDALRLLDVKKSETFEKLGESVGVA